jgi:peptidoglycan/LPS O-acetylase OafA/YrhL
VSLFFFTAGAYFSIHKMNFVEAFKPMLSALAPMYILIVAMALYFVGVGWWPYLYCAGVVVGLLLVISVSACFVENEKWRLSPFLTNSSFFIYAYHRLPLVFVIKILFKWIRPQSEGTLLLLYLVCPAIVILLGLLIYSLLKQCLPRFTAAISGGR